MVDLIMVSERVLEGHARMLECYIVGRRILRKAQSFEGERDAPSGELLGLASRAHVLFNFLSEYIGSSPSD